MMTIAIMSLLLLVWLFPGLYQNAGHLNTTGLLRYKEPVLLNEDGGRPDEILENDDFGGCWFDDFRDDEGTVNAVNVERALGRRFLSPYELGASPNCTGLWHFNEGAGNNVADYSDFGNPGTVIDASWTNGLKHNALAFDGTDDRVHIGDTPLLDNGTVEFWFAPGTDIDEDIEVMEALVSSDWNYVGIGNFTGELEDCRLHFRIGSNSSESSCLVSQKSTWTAGEWYHVAASWNSTKMMMYVNGALDNATDRTCPARWGANLTVGADTVNGLGRFFNGDIDELAVHQVTLSPGEIAEHSMCYHDLGRVTSKRIDLPPNACWEEILINKSESHCGCLKISVIDTALGRPIPFRENLTECIITMRNLDVNSIRLEAWFSSSGECTAILESWGVEWNYTRSIRDDFLGENKFTAEGDYRLSNSGISLAPNEFVADGDTLALWHCNEGMGRLSKDGSGAGNNAILRGVNWTLGAMDYAWEFDGIDDFVHVPHVPHLNHSGSLSVSAWFNTSDTSGGEQVVIDKRDAPDHGFLLALDASGRGVFQVGDGTDTCRLTGSTDLRDGEWHQIAGIMDVTRDVLEFYIDGELGASSGHGISHIYNVNPLRLGANSYAKTDFFKGFLDEVMILERVLSPDEVLAISRRFHYNRVLHRPNAKLT